MFGRTLTALTAALCGLFATTGVTSAAIEIDGRYEVMALSAIFWGGVIFLAFLVYLVKHAFDLDRMPPPPLQQDDSHGGHGAHH